MTRALILGAGGKLGRSICTRAARDLSVVTATRQQLDVTDPAALRRAVDAAAPGIIINGSAWAAVDEAEDHVAEAFAINAWAVLDMARLAAERGAVLVHFSTDFVFDGVAPDPHDETDTPRPRGAYGTSKLVGEWFAAEAPRHYILRVESLFGGPVRRGTIDGMQRELSAGRPVRAFTDRTVSPSHVDDVADAVVRLAMSYAPSGIYHVVNSGFTTWFDLARELARLLGASEALVEAATFATTAMKVPRPQHAALSNAKLRAAGVEMPAWQEALARYVAEAAAEA